MDCRLLNIAQVPKTGTDGTARLLRFYSEHFFKLKFYFHYPRFPFAMERHLSFAAALHLEIATILGSNLLQFGAKSRATLRGMDSSSTGQC
jgi:hypothetical protein